MLRLSDIIKHTKKFFEKKRKNPIQLENDSNLESNLKFLKVSDKSTPLQISDDTINIQGSLTVNGDSVQTGTDAGATTLNELSDVTYSSGDLTIDSLDTIISGALVVDSSGDITLDADGGNIIFKDGSQTVVDFDVDNDRLSIYYDANNWFRIGVAANGATTLTTSDQDPGSDGHLTLDADGAIRLDSHSGDFITMYQGTEFSATDSAYAGMILGYTRLQGDLSTQGVFEIQNSVTVEDSTHQITFKTPPSENVEIQATFVLNAVSTDSRVVVGLSDNATYNSIGVQFEYDSTGISFGDDEVDDGVRTVQFVLGASELASIGSSNTFYIGFGTAGVTKTIYLQYGIRATHGIADHPFVIKATALPATIYDGL